MHEAAERLRKVAATKNGCMVYNTNADAAVVHMRADQERLSDAMLRELDPTPIDEAWLESVGFAYEYLNGCSPYEWYKHPSGLIMWDFNNLYWICNQCDQGSIDVEYRTRGQIRTLFRALGIELKDQPMHEPRRRLDYTEPYSRGRADNYGNEVSDRDVFGEPLKRLRYHQESTPEPCLDSFEVIKKEPE